MNFRSTLCNVRRMKLKRSMVLFIGPQLSGNAGTTRHEMPPPVGPLREIRPPLPLNEGKGICNYQATFNESVWCPLDFYHHGLLLRTKIYEGGGKCTFTTGTLVADEANAGQAGLAVAAAGEGFVWVWCWSLTVLPPFYFILEAGPAGAFEGGDSLVDGVLPGLADTS